MKISCEDRISPYFRNMDKHPNEDIEIHIRFLDKIYQAGIFTGYTEEERLMVLDSLLAHAEKMPDKLKAIELFYAWKMNQMNGFDKEIPIIKLDEPFPEDEGRLEGYPPFADEKCKKFIDSIRPDPDGVELFNVQIPKENFNRNDFKLRDYSDEVRA